MSHSLNSLKGVIYGSVIGALKWDTRSLDYSSYSKLYTHLVRQPAWVSNGEVEQGGVTFIPPFKLLIFGSP